MAEAGQQIQAAGRSVGAGGRVLDAGGADCCCATTCAKWCYQRWTWGFSCADQTSTGDPVAHEWTCATPEAMAALVGWARTGQDGDTCLYQVWVPGPCCDVDATCSGLDDTTAPAPPAAADCAPVCDCCTPPGTALAVAVDATGMVPEVPLDTGEPGGWHTVTPVAPGDWHSHMGSPAWVAHPDTIFVGGGTMAYPGVGGPATYYDCGVTPDTQPTAQLPGFPVADFPGFGRACGDEGVYNFKITLDCNGDGTFSVGAEGWSNDDVLTGLDGPYKFAGINPAVILTCVDGRPVGTAVVPMQWFTSNVDFGPSSPYDCGTLTVVFT